MKKFILILVIVFQSFSISAAEKIVTYEVMSGIGVSVYVLNNGDISHFCIDENNVFKKSFKVKRGSKIGVEVWDESYAYMSRGVMGYPKTKIIIKIYINNRLYKKRVGYIHMSVIGWAR